MKKLLVTGFEPFGGEKINPSWEAVIRLPEKIGGWELKALLLPVSFQRVLPAVLETVEVLRPDAVLSVGQAGGREGLTPERIGINLDDARIPDNDGFCPVDCPIEAEGPAAWFSTLPVKDMAAAIEKAGIPSRVSNTAGTYVCNHLLYGLLHYAAHTRPSMGCGFLHVPWLPEQTKDKPGAFSLRLEEMVKGLEAAISVL